jgi:hypothetical protein
VQVIVVSRKSPGETVPDKERVVEKDRHLRKLPPCQQHKLPRQHVIVGRFVDVRRARLPAVPQGAQIDIAAVLVR